MNFFNKLLLLLLTLLCIAFLATMLVYDFTIYSRALLEITLWNKVIFIITYCSAAFSLLDILSFTRKSIHFSSLEKVMKEVISVEEKKNKIKTMIEKYNAKDYSLIFNFTKFIILIVCIVLGVNATYLTNETNIFLGFFAFWLVLIIIVGNLILSLGTKLLYKKLEA